VYAHVQDEFAHEQHVAEVLGVTLDDLKEPYVSKAAAQKIARRAVFFRENSFLAFRAEAGALEVRGITGVVLKAVYEQDASFQQRKKIQCEYLAFFH